jgi:4,5-DOPA dioxygenase extradiol
MRRDRFLKTLAVVPLLGTLARLKGFASGLPYTPRMPVLFLGHGSPMNAIEENDFVRGFREVAARIPRPRGIVCVSAHWETRGTRVTAMPQPRTIHDFHGFPPELYAVQYPALGDPLLAGEVRDLARKTHIEDDHAWGLDHGAWSVLRHLFPLADVPVVQMSLNTALDPAGHFALATELAALRDRGVLIVGSGNIVHNLGLVAWDELSTPGFAFDWAAEARATINGLILDGDYSALLDIRSRGTAFRQAIPTPEHYLPLLYVLAQRTPRDSVRLFNDVPVAGSLTMTSVVVG